VDAGSYDLLLHTEGHVIYIYTLRSLLHIYKSISSEDDNRGSWIFTLHVS